MALTSEEYQDYIGLAVGMALDLKQQSDAASSCITRELAAYIDLIEGWRIPKMRTYLDVLQRKNEHEKASLVTSAIESLLEDVRRSRIALAALQESGS